MFYKVTLAIYSVENGLKEDKRGCEENNSEVISVAQKEKMGAKIMRLSSKGTE